MIIYSFKKQGWNFNLLVFIVFGSFVKDSYATRQRPLLQPVDSDREPEENTFMKPKDHVTRPLLKPFDPDREPKETPFIKPKDHVTRPLLKPYAGSKTPETNPPDIKPYQPNTQSNGASSNGGKSSSSLVPVSNNSINKEDPVFIPQKGSNSETTSNAISNIDYQPPYPPSNPSGHTGSKGSGSSLGLVPVAASGSQTVSTNSGQVNPPISGITSGSGALSGVVDQNKNSPEAGSISSSNLNALNKDETDNGRIPRSTAEPEYSLYKENGASSAMHHLELILFWTSLSLFVGYFKPAD